MGNICLFTTKLKIFISTHVNLVCAANEHEEFRQQNVRTFGLKMTMLPSNEILHVWEVILVVIS